jgi:hypothetical protein
VEWRDVDAVVAGRRFRVVAFEDLKAGDQPAFLTQYHELIELEVDGELRPRWAYADFPLERRTTADECLHAGLAHVDRLGER